MAAYCLLLCVFCLTGSLAKKHEEFGYDTEGEMSPDKWSETFQTCSGKYQSPIDIEENLVYRVSLPPLDFDGFDDAPLSTVITNNGHTVMLQLNHSQPVTISGGPLPGEYTFSQLHFHWGVNDSYGSEDTINNVSYPMELHMVFFKTDYGEMEKAVDYKDGLLVLAFFFEITPMDNPVYDDIIKAFPSIEYPNTATSLVAEVSLKEFLPKNTNRYFTYKGSLTTPPCLEVVTWIDFKHPIHLSPQQLSEFRKLRSYQGFLTHNSRPIQPLSGRPVWYNVGEPIESRSTTTSSSIVLLLISMLSLRWVSAL
uniref:carbonic anhydrase n=1 Tax=Clastoptera arizonana TaxID=38151 RepID=A0A1B6CME5_9HEMI